VTVADITALVRSRSTSARDVVEQTLAHIARVDGRLVAFTAVFAERALARAARIDADIAAGVDPGPLSGVPFAAKNLFDVAGIVTRAGATVTAHDPPAARDADAVAALEAQGAILVGVTNMDEFAYGFVTENAHDGTTRNPHDLERIAGGSSGGSAAAVGAELVPLALASDTNGSIRVPAALCGIFGLRPTLGGLSRRGAFPFAGSLDTVGPFARTAHDLTTAYAALDPRFTPYGGQLAGLRVARLRGYFEHGLTPPALRAVDLVCAALGRVDDVTLAEAARAREAAFIITGAEGGELHAARLRVHADDFDPATRDRLTAGALVPAAWYIRAQRFRSWFRESIGEALSRHDVLIAAATPYPATLAGQRTLTIDGVEIDIRPNLGVFTQPLSLAGVPIAAVPVSGGDPLPLGVQLIGRPGSENVLLALAAELERRGTVGAQPPAAFPDHGGAPADRPARARA
jgi:aspartyl-tRNA(Asn)/glutamyl-tRNA(Gln) amidotransferase subunit A